MALNTPYTPADQSQILEWKYEKKKKKKCRQVHKDPRDVGFFPPLLPASTKNINKKPSLSSKSNVTSRFTESPLRRQEEKHAPEQADDASQVSTTSSSRVECFI